jgi:MFS family permease
VRSTNAAPSLGPVVGGILAEKAGWRWISWLLSILSGLMFAGLILFFPETCRCLVDDGSVPNTGINMTVAAFFKRTFVTQHRVEAEKQKQHLHMPNPLKILPVLADRGSLFVILVGSVVYTVFGCLGASLSAQCIQLYDLNYLEAGLIYIPSGLGGIIAAYTIGKHDRSSWKYTHPVGSLNKVACSTMTTPSQQNATVLPSANAKAKISQTSPSRKPDYAAYGALLPLHPPRRSDMAGLYSSERSVLYPRRLSERRTLLTYRQHLAAPLVLQFLTGSTMVGMFTALSTLLTDLNPDRTSTSQAAYNLLRCLLGAAGVAALQGITGAIGLGFCFTVYGTLCAMTIPLLVVLHARGLSWRQSKVRNRDQCIP